jgi:hypothetical protein
MPMIDRDTLAKALETIATAENRDVETIAATLRKDQEMIVSTCSEDDVCGVPPLARTPGVNVYLLSANGGCLGLTRDPEIALGLVLAEVGEE